MWTKHKIVLPLSLRRLIFDSPLTHFFFLLQHHHLQYVIRKNERARSLNYGRCLQWYAKFAKKEIARKLRQHQKSQDNQYYIHQSLTWEISSIYLLNIKKQEMIQWNIRIDCCLLKIFNWSKKKRNKEGEREKKEKKVK
jgi:hypothetical protein